MKRLALTLAAITVLTLSAFAGQASAHDIVDADLTGTVACNPATGLFDITWTHTNAQAGNSAYTIDSNTRGLTFSPNPIAQAGSSSASETVGVGTFTLTASGHFATGETDTATASVTTAGPCSPPVIAPPPDPPRVVLPAVPVVAPPHLTG